MTKAIKKATPLRRRSDVKSAELIASVPVVKAPVEAHEVETVNVDQDGQMCLWRVSDVPHRQRGSI